MRFLNGFSIVNCSACKELQKLTQRPRQVHYKCQSCKNILSESKELSGGGDKIERDCRGLTQPYSAEMVIYLHWVKSGQVGALEVCCFRECRQFNASPAGLQGVQPFATREKGSDSFLLCSFIQKDIYLWMLLLIPGTGTTRDNGAGELLSLLSSASCRYPGFIRAVGERRDRDSATVKEQRSISKLGGG